MGGWGSGRYRHSATTTSESKRVDIRFLRKQGWLYDGRIGSLSWTCRGEPSGNVFYSINGDTFILDYKVREPGADEWLPIELLVPLTSIPMRYGGRRYYFICLGQGCGRRCEVLYSAGNYFVCRKCAGLIYDSQKGGELDKLIEAKHKLGERIFEYYEDGEGLGKKKGMHWKTFNRLYSKYRALENAWSQGVARRFGYDEALQHGLIDRYYVENQLG